MELVELVAGEHANTLSKHMPEFLPVLYYKRHMSTERMVEQMSRNEKWDISCPQYVYNSVPSRITMH
jgi:hypothetical protein